MLHTVFVEEERTADYQTSTGLLRILGNNGNADDLMAFMFERNLMIDELGAREIAEELLGGVRLTEGYLTISNAYQWRLQYARVITEAGRINGIIRVR